MKTCLINLTLFLLTTFQLQAQRALQLYGGKDHDQYLGCINCNDFDVNSIWNTSGKYGSKYSSNSIWNDAGNYGNKYSSVCPFNENAAAPPAIMDADGNFYGYLTVNKYHEKRSDNPIALAICAHWQAIQKNVAGWYKKIVN